MTTIIQPHRVQGIGTHLEEETTMYKGLITRPWGSQAVENAKRRFNGDKRLAIRLKMGYFNVRSLFTWNTTPQGWRYWEQKKDY